MTLNYSMMIRDGHHIVDMSPRTDLMTCWERFKDRMKDFWEDLGRAFQALADACRKISNNQ